MEEDKKREWKYISVARGYISAGYNVYFNGLKIFNIGYSGTKRFSALYNIIDTDDKKILVPGIKEYHINEYNADDLLSSIKIEDKFLREILNEQSYGSNKNLRK